MDTKPEVEQCVIRNKKARSALTGNDGLKLIPLASSRSLYTNVKTKQDSLQGAQDIRVLFWQTVAPEVKLVPVTPVSPLQ